MLDQLLPVRFGPNHRVLQPRENRLADQKIFLKLQFEEFSRAQWIVAKNGLAAAHIGFVVLPRVLHPVEIFAQHIGHARLGLPVQFRAPRKLLEEAFDDGQRTGIVLLATDNDIAVRLDQFRNP